MESSAFVVMLTACDVSASCFLISVNCSLTCVVKFQVILSSRTSASKDTSFLNSPISLCNSAVSSVLSLTMSCPFRLSMAVSTNASRSSCVIMVFFPLFCGALRVASSVSTIAVDMSQKPSFSCSSLVGGIAPCKLFGWGTKLTCLPKISTVLPTHCL